MITAEEARKYVAEAWKNNKERARQALEEKLVWGYIKAAASFGKTQIEIEMDESLWDDAAEILESQGFMVNHSTGKLNMRILW